MSTSAGSPASSWWPLGAASTVLLVTTCLCLGAGGALALRSLRGGQDAAPVALQPVRPALAGDAVWKAGKRPAPGFSLRDQDGRLVSLASQRGSVVLLAFMDSHCRLLCTLEGPTIHRALGKLGAAAPDVRLLVVSVNPWQDTVASSRRAGAHWGFSGRWVWLRGPPSQLETVWRNYRIDVQQAFGDVNHSSAVYLIDREGNERAGFNYPFPANAVASDLRKLAAAHT